MITKQQFLAIALVGLMVMSAGCAGWGTDGPADGNDSTENDSSDDLEEADNESNDSDTSGGSDGSDGSDSSDDESASGSQNSDPQRSSGVDGTPDDSSSQSVDDSDSDTSDSSDSSDTSDSDSSDSDSDSGTSDGSDGTDGSDGSDGSDGDDGSDGSDGSDGADGDDGSDGDDGDDGTSGDDGDTDEPETHTLTTTVTGPDGEAVEGADVSIVTYDGGADVASGTTNADGQAQFDLEDGSYEILVSHDDYAQPSDDRLVDIDGADVNRTIQLESTSEPRTYDFSVTVQESDGSYPLAGVDVTLTNADGDVVATLTTNEDGQVVFEDLVEGEYTLSIDGYDGEQFEDPGEATVTVPDEENHVFSLVEAGNGEQEYADASALVLEDYKHGGAEPFTDFDEISFRNSDEQLPLDVSGWTIDFGASQPTVTIPDETVIAPGETLGMTLDQADKVLNPAGGTMVVYTADGSEVFEESYIGSPSNPYMPTDPNETGGENESGNETGGNAAVAAVV